MRWCYLGSMVGSVGSDRAELFDFDSVDVVLSAYFVGVELKVGCSKS